VICEICEAPCEAGVAPWHFTCPVCRIEYGSLRPAINDAATDALDEAARARGLKAVRTRGYRAILTSLERIERTEGKRLLEVGSAHGWFLDAASERFGELVGIEPDDAVRTSSRGNISVRNGYFPDAVGAHETFDAIVFNDVFEHIPRTTGVAKAVATHLSPSGVAVVTLPVCSGFFYRLAKRLTRVGVARPFERLWQCDYPSPHLYYFSHDGLTRLFASAGLGLEAAQPMRTLTFNGLWQRIRYGERNGLLTAATYIAALALLPFLALLPPDTVTFIFRKRPLGVAGQSG